jgi:hypothetical protein
VSDLAWVVYAHEPKHEQIRARDAEEREDSTGFAVIAMMASYAAVVATATITSPETGAPGARSPIASS